VALEEAGRGFQMKDNQEDPAVAEATATMVRVDQVMFHQYLHLKVMMVDKVLTFLTYTQVAAVVELLKQVVMVDQALEELEVMDHQIQLQDQTSLEVVAEVVSLSQDQVVLEDPEEEQQELLQEVKVALLVQTLAVEVAEDQVKVLNNLQAVKVDQV
tara:strand:+ start:121 stop:591 length:471 start_codon:yes stop_codon:yes gene_type:complete